MAPTAEESMTTAELVHRLNNCAHLLSTVHTHHGRATVTAIGDRAAGELRKRSKGLPARWIAARREYGI